MNDPTIESTKPADVAKDGVPGDPMNVPLLHRFALTLFMATQSELQQIKNNPSDVDDFLTDVGISEIQKPDYKAAIKNFDSDPQLKKSLENLGPMLKSVLGQFYPTNPCPRLPDSVVLMDRLK